MGIEPTLAAWEAAVLPLNYTRMRHQSMPAAGDWQRATPAVPAPARLPQNPPPTVAKAVVCLPPFSPAFRLTPRLASRPSSEVRAPRVSVA